MAAGLLLLVAGCGRGSEPQMIGKPAPDFTVSDHQRSINLRQHRGKVVVLNFWATWCPPCVAEMPSLVAMQKRMKDKVVVLAISTDDDERAYKDFVQKRMPGLLTVRDAAKNSSELYGSFRYPETYIIDRQGVLRRKFIGPVEWEKPEIIEYLDKL